MVMIGIDPHKGSHTAVVIDRDERVVDEIRVRTSKAQTAQLYEWASGYPDRVWAVESARGLGYLVSQQLVAAGERVVDVPAMMASRVRLLNQASPKRPTRTMLGRWRSPLCVTLDWRWSAPTTMPECWVCWRNGTAMSPA